VREINWPKGTIPHIHVPLGNGAREINCLKGIIPRLPVTSRNSRGTCGFYRKKPLVIVSSRDNSRDLQCPRKLIQWFLQEFRQQGS
jgi:hypothetical protein